MKPKTTQPDHQPPTVHEHIVTINLFRPAEPEEEIRPTESSSPEIALALRIAKNLDPMKVFRRSEDKNGHSESLRIRVPAWWANVSGHVVEKSNGLFANRSELFRDSIIKGNIFWLQHIEDIDPAIMAPFIIDAESNRSQMELQAIKETGNNIRKAASLYVSLKDWGGLFEFLDEQTGHAAQLREPHRARILKTINAYAAKYAKYKGAGGNG